MGAGIGRRRLQTNSRCGEPLAMRSLLMALLLCGLTTAQTNRVELYQIDMLMTMPPPQAHHSWFYWLWHRHIKQQGFRVVWTSPNRIEPCSPSTEEKEKTMTQFENEPTCLDLAG